MYYLNARYYNPELGRFINADSEGGQTGELLSHNVFAYCANNPVNLDDPSGCWPNWGKIWESTKMVASKVLETVKKVTQFLTPSTSTKAAVAIATGVVAYKFLKPQKVSAKRSAKVKKTTARDFAKSKGVPSTLTEEEAVVANSSDLQMSMKKINDNYLKRRDIDAHELKIDFVGNKNISKYDLYVEQKLERFIYF